MTTEKSTLEKVNGWAKKSISLKLATISLLALLLLIPASMVQSLIKERENLNNSAVKEVSAKWAEEQHISGPILSIPVVYEYEENKEIKTAQKYFHLLPEELNINGNIDPKRLNRGIYEVVVYESDLALNGKFSFKEKPSQGRIKTIEYDKAFLTIGISDLRGIKDNVVVKWNNQSLEVTPGSRIQPLIASGITIDLPLINNSLANTIDFSFNLDLQGSENISFTPVGRTSNVNLTSSWSSPKFNGAFLPDHRELTEKGFNADWKILQLNRNYPQSWMGSGTKDQLLKASSFGVNLLSPLGDYQKSMRSAKYALMTIALTFLIFFLVEVLNKRRIHPLQYILVGLALSLFYVLLVSLSEHISFDKAYGISTIGIITMIGLYSLSIFKKRALSFLLISILTGIYGFLFVTLQLEEYALLMGSIGLTLILGATMYFTRNIEWYKLNMNADQ